MVSEDEDAGSEDVTTIAACASAIDEGTKCSLSFDEVEMAGSGGDGYGEKALGAGGSAENSRDWGEGDRDPDDEAWEDVDAWRTW